MGDVMKLLLERGQSVSSGFSLVPLRIGGGVLFKLNASLELDAAETKLLETYNLSRAPLVTSDALEDLKKGFRPALVLGLICLLVTWFFTNLTVATWVALLVVLVMTFVYFNALREQIMVSDLLHGGRAFWCDSVVTLIEKEDDLHRMCQFLRQVLESAKHWDDREAIDIEPLSPQELKQAILRATR